MRMRGSLRTSLAAAAFATLLAGIAGAQESSAPPAGGTQPRTAPIVEACIDPDGKVVSTRIVESSGFPGLDEAAIKIAKANRYTPGVEGGKKMKLSCVKFRVKFVVTDDGSPAEAKAAETPGN